MYVQAEPSACADASFSYRASLRDRLKTSMHRKRTSTDSGEEEEGRVARRCTARFLSSPPVRMEFTVILSSERENETVLSPPSSSPAMKRAMVVVESQDADRRT